MRDSLALPTWYEWYLRGSVVLQPNGPRVTKPSVFITRMRFRWKRPEFARDIFDAAVVA
jgi:hypothetical protein